VDPSFVALLRCPACGSESVVGEGRTLACSGCQRHYALADAGYLDLLQIDVGEPAASTPAQRFMESELVARLYDRLWRPTFVRVFAGRGAAGSAGGFGGEFFIHKNALGLDERPGPYLDLSCGPGAFSRAMAAAAPGETIVGVDISRAMLEAAAQRLRGYGNVVLVRADAQKLPFGDGQFGGVNNAGALHVYDDPEAAFCEVFRVLRPGGIYVGSTFAESSRAAGRLAARLTGIRRFDPAELRAWLSRIGFSEYEQIRLGDGFVFRARKP
jgi:SAM-dependent methyltransferase